MSYINLLIYYGVGLADNYTMSLMSYINKSGRKSYQTVDSYTVEYARKHHIKLESGTKYNIHHHFGYEKVNKSVTRRSWTDINMMYTSQYHVNPGNEIVMDTQSNQLVALI